MKKIFVFLRALPVMMMSSEALSPVMHCYTKGNKLVLFVLALPMLFMFIYTMQLIGLIYLLLQREKWVIGAELKRKKVFDASYFGKRITICRVFYIVLTSNKERIASVLAYGSWLEKKNYLCAYRPIFAKRKVVFDPLATILLCLQIIFCGILILGVGPPLDGLTTWLWKRLHA